MTFREPALPLPRLITHRAILSIAIPMMFAYLSTAMEGSVATAAIGRLGIAALSAGIAIAAILFDVVLGSLNFLRSTAVGLTAIALAADRAGDARAILQRSLALSVLLGGIILVLAQFETGFGLQLLGAHGAMLQAALGYVLIRAWSAPFALSNFVLLGALLGRGQAKASLALQIVLNGSNIVICIVTVLDLHWGVQGAAWAAVGGEAAAFAAGLAWLRITAGPISPGILEALADAEGWRKMGGLNVDTMIRSLALLFAFAFFTRQGARMGAVMLAANAIHLQFFALTSNCLDGFAAAAEQQAARMIGLRKLAGLASVARLTLGWSLACGAVMTLLYLEFGDDFIALLTRVQPVRLAANASLGWAALVPLVAAPAFQFDGIFIGATWSRDMRNMMLVSLGIFIASWVALTPFLGHAKGGAGLWLSFLIFFGVRGVTLGLTLRRRLRSGLDVGGGVMPAAT